MNKRTLFLSALVIFVLALAACSGAGEDNSGTPVADDVLGTAGVTEMPGELPGTGAESTDVMTDTLSTPLATSDLSATEPAATVSPIATQEITGTAPAETQAVETPAATQVVTGTTGTPGAGGLPGTGAQGEAMRLSDMFGYTVVNQNGDRLGTASNYILNLCESHILYIVLQPARMSAEASGDTAAGTGTPQSPRVAPTGNLILIPYEVVSVHGGQLDAENRQIMVTVDADQLQNAPIFNRADLDMSSTGWESSVVSYWSDTVGMDMTLTSECTVQAPDLTGTGAVTGTITPTLTTTQTVSSDTEGMVDVHKIALASNVLSAQVQDGNGVMLGQVQEVLVTPATGRMEFIAVRMEGSEATGGPVALVPLRALNLMIDSPAQVHLVLLVETSILQGAPTWDDQTGSLSQGWDDDAFEYWSQHVTMTRENDQ